MAKKTLKPGPFVLPMPLVLVGARVDGTPNFMPAAFAGIVNYAPVVVALGLNPQHHTCRGIEADEVLSLNLPTPEMVAVTDFCGLKSGAKVDKSALFDVFYGDVTRVAPMIVDCPLTVECKLLQTVPFAVDTLYLAEVVGVHAEERVLTEGQPDWRKIEPLLFTFPDRAYWRLGEHVAPAWKAGRTYDPDRA